MSVKYGYQVLDFFAELNCIPLHYLQIFCVEAVTAFSHSNSRACLRTMISELCSIAMKIPKKHSNMTWAGVLSACFCCKEPIAKLIFVGEFWI